MFLVSMKLCGLWRPDRQLGDLLSEAGFEKVFRTQNWVRFGFNETLRLMATGQATRRPFERSRF